jgi:leucyl/phenylalanyl-tRNA--protein transferase
MPIFYIPDNQNIFPHPDLADKEGLLAIGGNLSTDSLITAYSFGIFPWYSENDPLVWWSPDPRFVLFPEKLKVSKSMRPYFNQNKYQISIDTKFEYIIRACSRIQRKGQKGTWITDAMYDAYIQLHKEGFAHSIEVWKDGKLAGGLYGVSLGKMFFGESMFSLLPNASKFGFISLVRLLISKGYQLIDCQQETPHLRSLGAEGITRKAFLHLLRQNRMESSHIGNWSDWIS